MHVLAALALMGLGCLWLLMNLSAEFAHARRDMRELPGRSPTALTQVSHIIRGQTCTRCARAVVVAWRSDPGGRGLTVPALFCVLVLQDVLTAIQDAPYSGTSPKKGMVTKTAARDQVCVMLSVAEHVSHYKLVCLPCLATAAFLI